jgi:rod shape-determining protein MreD
MSPSVRVPPFVLVMVLLQTAVFPQLRVFNVAADVLLLVAIGAGVVGGPERGAVLGFVGGLLADSVLTTTPFGLSALVYCLVGWCAGSFQTRILHATWWIPVLTAAAATAMGTLLFAGLGAVLGQEQFLSWRLLPICGVTALWSAALCPAVTRLCRWALMPDPTRALVMR